MPEPREKGGVGALIGSIIIILILVLGALYFWGKEVNEKQKNLNQENATSSDNVSGIEDDLNAEDFSNIDADFNAALEAE